LSRPPKSNLEVAVHWRFVVNTERPPDLLLSLQSFPTHPAQTFGVNRIFSCNLTCCAFFLLPGFNTLPFFCRIILQFRPFSPLCLMHFCLRDVSVTPFVFFFSHPSQLWLELELVFAAKVPSKALFPPYFYSPPSRFCTSTSGVHGQPLTPPGPRSYYSPRNPISWPL